MENAIHIPTLSLNVVGTSLSAMAGGEVTQGQAKSEKHFIFNGDYT